MKLSSHNTAILGLLSVLLAVPTVATAVAREEVATTRVLVDCTDEDFLVTEFIVTEAGANTTQESYEGCYEEADTLDDDLELAVYKIDGDLTTAGGTFYASDNNGGYEEPVWFFAVVEEDTATQNVSDSFLCFDLDLNTAADTHPADVTNWGLSIDGSSSTSRFCEITITCGCSADDDDEEDDDDDDDDDDASDDDETVGATNAAFSVTASSGNGFVMVAGSILLAVVNAVRP